MGSVERRLFDWNPSTSLSSGRSWKVGGWRIEGTGGQAAGSDRRRTASQVEEDTVTAVISVSIKRHLTSALACTSLAFLPSVSFFFSSFDRDFYFSSFVSWWMSPTTFSPTEVDPQTLSLIRRWQLGIAFDSPSHDTILFCWKNISINNPSSSCGYYFSLTSSAFWVAGLNFSPLFLFIPRGFVYIRSFFWKNTVCCVFVIRTRTNIQKRHIAAKRKR